MPTTLPTVNQALRLASQARLSELLNIQIQVTRAIHDEYDGIMGPDGQGWDKLLDDAFPGSTSSGSVEGPLTNAGTASTVATTSDLTVRVPPTKTHYNSPPIPAVPSPTGTAAIPANACTQDLTPEQRQAEWRIIIHYSDTRAKMSQDQLAHAHAAFLRWFGWAPTKEEMQRSREVARGTAEVLKILGSGPWSSPFATEVWYQAILTQSIAKIEELKNTDWAMADKLAAVVGVTLKQEDKPKATTKKTKAKSTKETVTTMQGRIPEDMDLDMGVVNQSLIVKLKTKAGELFPPSMHPISSEVASQVPAIHARHQLPPASTTALAHSRLASHFQQMAVNDGRKAYPHQFLQDPVAVDGDSKLPGGYPNQAPPLPTDQSAAASSSTGRGWVKPIQWIANRAADLGRSLRQSTDAQLNPLIQFDTSASTKPAEPPQSTETVVGTQPGNTNNSDEDADPSMQLHQEMLMHTSSKQTQEATVNIKQEEEEDNALVTTDHHHQSPVEEQSTVPESVVPTSSSKADTQTLFAGIKPTEKRKVRKSFYNYGADVTPDPRVNALIAYLIICWRAKNNRNLTTNPEAMERVKIHAIAALPAVIQESQAQMPTRGMFRWGDNVLTWELNLKKIDAFVSARAKTKREIEKKNSASSPYNAAAMGSGSTAKKSIPTIPFVKAGMPSPPQTVPAPRHPLYPDASIVAISELTPDSRANALAAYLAQSFYKSSGVDLMADHASKRKLRLYAVRNEHPLQGQKRTSVYELNFWDGQDLRWDLKGFQLDALKDEWIKRFPEAEESEREEEKDDNNDSDNQDDVDNDDEKAGKGNEQERTEAARNSPTGSLASTSSKRSHSATRTEPQFTSDNISILSGEDSSDAASDGDDSDHDAETEPASKKARLSCSPPATAASPRSPDFVAPAPELSNLVISPAFSPPSPTQATFSRHSPALSHDPASPGVDMSIISGASPERGDNNAVAESETDAAITAAIDFLDS